MSAVSPLPLSPAPLSPFSGRPTPTVLAPVPTAGRRSFPSCSATSAAAAAGLSARSALSSYRKERKNTACNDFDSMANHLRQQSKSKDFMERDGEWIGGLVCPWCNGGHSAEKSFSIKYASGDLVCKCWRKTKCGLTRVFRQRGERTRQKPQQQWKDRLQGRAQPTAQKTFAPFRAASGQGDSSSCSKAKLGRCMVDLVKEHQDFFAERGISEETWKRMRVCSKFVKGGKAAIVFPYYEDDQLVAEKFRLLPKMFWQTAGGKASLYGLDDVKGQEEVVITEGEIDKLSFDEAGIRCSASLQGGASALPEALAEMLRSSRRVVLAVDGDKAGQDCAIQLASQLRWGRCYLVKWPEGCKDANEVLLKYGKEAVRRLVEEAEAMKSPLDDLRLNNEATLKLVKQRVEGKMPSEQIYGVQSGWHGVDRLWRLVPGEITVLTGTPGSGKSEFLLSLAVNLGHLHDYRTLVFAFESTGRNLASQLYLKARSSHVFSEPAAGEEEEHYRQVMEWVDDHILVESEFQADDATSIEAILKTAKHEATTGRMNVVIIDPYNFIDRSEDDAGMLETYFIGKLLQRLRKFAEDFGVHVIIVAHPTKASSWDGEKPSLYTIAGSADWFNKTDNGVVVHRREIADENAKMVPTNQLEIVVEKVRNREAGQTGKTLLYFDRERRCYRDAPQSHAVCSTPPGALRRSAASAAGAAVNGAAPAAKREVVVAAAMEEEHGEY